MICPLCASRLAPEAESCPNCGVGLKEYASLAYLPHWLYNQALAASRRGQWGQAATQFARAALFLPSDPEVLRGWAWALVETGQIEEALEKISEALDLGDRADLREDYAAIIELATAEPVRPLRRRPAYLASRPQYRTVVLR